MDDSNWKLQIELEKGARIGNWSQASGELELEREKKVRWFLS